MRIRIRNFLDAFGLIPLYGFIAFILIYCCCYAQEPEYTDGQVLNPSAPPNQVMSLHKVDGLYSGSSTEHPFKVHSGFQYEGSEWINFDGNPSTLSDETYGAGLPVLFGDVTGNYSDAITLSDYPSRPTGYFLRDANAPEVDNYVDENGDVQPTHGYQFFAISFGGQPLSWKDGVLNRMTDIDAGIGAGNNDESSPLGQYLRTLLNSGIVYAVWTISPIILASFAVLIIFLLVRILRRSSLKV